MAKPFFFELSVNFCPRDVICNAQIKKKNSVFYVVFYAVNFVQFNQNKLLNNNMFSVCSYHQTGIYFLHTCRVVKLKRAAVVQSTPLRALWSRLPVWVTFLAEEQHL